MANESVKQTQDELLAAQVTTSGGFLDLRLCIVYILYVWNTAKAQTFNGRDSILSYVSIMSAFVLRHRLAH